MNVIRYRAHMEDSFPFKIQIKDAESLGRSDTHAHEYFQICYVLKGSCTHIVSGKRATLVKGDLFSIPPLYEHSLEAIPGEDSEVAHIDFMPHLLDRSLTGLTGMDSFVDFAYIQPFVHLNDQLLPKLNLSFAGQRQVESLIAEMIEEFVQREEGYPFLIKSDLQKLLVLAGREFTSYTGHTREH